MKHNFSLVALEFEDLTDLLPAAVVVEGTAGDANWFSALFIASANLLSNSSSDNITGTSLALTEASASYPTLELCGLLPGLNTTLSIIGGFSVTSLLSSGTASS